jgi:hypothetical protein
MNNMEVEGEEKIEVEGEEKRSKRIGVDWFICRLDSWALNHP